MKELLYLHCIGQRERSPQVGFRFNIAISAKPAIWE